MIVAMLSVNLVGLWAWSGLPDGHLKIWYLDVGQGDAILMRLPAGEWILTDAGPDSSILDRLGEIIPFYEKEIELVILTHPHADHINGLPEILNRYKVNNLLLSGVNYDYAAYRQIMEMARLKGVKLRYPRQGEDLRLGKAALDLIYPERDLIGKSFGNINNSSIVYRLIFGEFSGFFSGDLELEKELEVVSRAELNLSADVLKAGHHASKTSNSPELLEKIRPQAVIVSCGVDNTFKHPFAGTLENFKKSGAEVFRTDLEGTIEIVSDGFSFISRGNARNV